MKRNDVKSLLLAAAVLTAVLAVQMVLSRVFTWHVGEVFSRTALGALFFYALIRMGRRRRKAEK